MPHHIFRKLEPAMAMRYRRANETQAPAPTITISTLGTTPRRRPGARPAIQRIAAGSSGTALATNPAL